MSLWIPQFSRLFLTAKGPRMAKIAWLAAILTTFLSMGPSFLLVMLCSPNAFADLTSTAQNPNYSDNPKLYDLLHDSAVRLHEVQMTTLLMQTASGTLLYLLALGLVVPMLRAPDIETRWHGRIISVGLALLLLYGLLHLSGTLYVHRY